MWTHNLYNSFSFPKGFLFLKKKRLGAEEEIRTPELTKRLDFSIFEKPEILISGFLITTRLTGSSLK